MLSVRQKDNDGGRKERTANEKQRKMLDNSLSANAKEWLLAKHHFATSSIFYQHVNAQHQPPSLQHLLYPPLIFLCFHWEGITVKLQS